MEKSSNWRTAWGQRDITAWTNCNNGSRGWRLTCSAVNLVNHLVNMVEYLVSHGATETLLHGQTAPMEAGRQEGMRVWRLTCSGVNMVNHLVNMVNNLIQLVKY